MNQKSEVTVPDYVLSLTKDQVFDLFVNNKITEEQYLHATKLIELNQSFEVEQKNNSSEIEYKMYNDKGIPIAYFPNWKILMDHYGVSFKYNKITRNIEIIGLGTASLNDCITDVETICVENQIILSDNKIWAYMQRLANEYAYNPVHEYLMNCYFKWDKERRIQKIFDSVITKDDYNKELKELLMKRWLVATARIATNSLELNKPLQCEGVLVFQGKQGLGKTRWANSIIPNELVRYYKENFELKTNDKDSIFNATSNWICELGEMASSMNASSVDSLKMFFTNGVDRQRRPYERTYTDFPRLTSFFGTINDSEFLQDETGNRRYWIIRVEDFNMSVLDGLDLDQVWGEIMYMLLDEHEPHWLSREEQHILELSNEDSRIIQPIEYKVEINFDWDASKEDWKLILAAEIVDYLALGDRPRGLRSALERFGAKWKKSNGRIYYLVPPFKSVYSQGK